MKVLIYLIVISPGWAIAQDLVLNENGMIHAQQVFEFPGKPAAEIYRKSKMWINNIYKNPDAVTTGDVEGQALKGNGYRECGAVMKGIVPICFDLEYRFAIDIKDGRARLTINDLRADSDYGYKNAEIYCLKKSGEFRTNSQARAILAGFQSISTDLLTSYAQIFDVSTADNW